MPNAKQVLAEVQLAGGNHDAVRWKYLGELHKHTSRNVIAYYSAFLQKRDLFPAAGGMFAINDLDKNALMATIHGLDRSKGLDLILHTPGGSIAATESIVDYLRKMFGTDIRAIVPQLAMSAGTMIALSCRVVMMGKHSSLGPTDPQIGGIPAHGVLEEFNAALNSILANPASAALWHPIISKYNPTLIGSCQKAIKLADEMVKEWLVTGMLNGHKDREGIAVQIVQTLGTHNLTLSHDRHFSCDKLRALGVIVEDLEQDQKLQDLVLTVHHASMQTLMATNTIKLVENHNGVAQVVGMSLNMGQGRQAA